MTCQLPDRTSGQLMSHPVEALLDGLDGGRLPGPDVRALARLFEALVVPGGTAELSGLDAARTAFVAAGAALR